MITVNSVVLSGGPLPAPGTAGQVLTLDGGLAPAWEDASNNGSLPRLAAGSLLHLWRLDGATYTDLGSSPVTLAAVGTSWLTQRPGPYVGFGATQQTSPADGGDRIGATLADIPSGSDFTVGCTVSRDPNQSTPANGAMIFGLGDGVDFVDGSAGTFFTVQYVTSGTAALLSCAIGGHNTNGTPAAIDWTRPHRFELTYTDSTRTARLYADGTLIASAVMSSGSVPALTRVFAGGCSVASSISTAGSNLSVADLTVELTALSAAAVAARHTLVRAWMRGL